MDKARWNNLTESEREGLLYELMPEDAWEGLRARIAHADWDELTALQKAAVEEIE